MDGATGPARLTACTNGYRPGFAPNLHSQIFVRVPNPMTASGTASVALTEREKSLCNGINPWLAPVAMVLTQDVALKGFFVGQVMKKTRGQANPQMVQQLLAQKLPPVEGA